MLILKSDIQVLIIKKIMKMGWREEEGEEATDDGYERGKSL